MKKPTPLQRRMRRDGPCAQHAHSEDNPPNIPGDSERLSLFMQQLDRWTAAMERLRLAEYLRYVDDRKRLFWSNFWGGMARGVGMAVGFTILGAVLILVLQDLARHNLPLIGDMLAQIMDVIQNRLK